VGIWIEGRQIGQPRSALQRIIAPEVQNQTRIDARLGARLPAPIRTPRQLLGFHLPLRKDFTLAMLTAANSRRLAAGLSSTMVSP
jgi:hypothetical protein